MKHSPPTPAAARPWRRVRVPSFAKVNLDIRVLHRRPDGYHEIRSLFHSISLRDRIEIAFAPGRGIHVSTICAGADIPEQENLAHRAALAYVEQFRVRGDLRIVIEKQIPLGGGLGGGSSNAAAVLLALPPLTGKRASLDTLVGLAAALGSDVPFFLLGGAAVAMGRGEELYPAPDFPSLPGLLVASGIHVSTPAAYRALARTEQSEASARIVREFSSQFVANTDLAARWDGSNLGVNDFESPVFRLHPILKSWKNKLKQSGALHTMMSGSGSSVFGLFPHRNAMSEAGAKLSGADLRPFRLISRRQYRQQWLRSLSAFSDNQWPPQPKSETAPSPG